MKAASRTVDASTCVVSLGLRLDRVAEDPVALFGLLGAFNAAGWTVNAPESLREGVYGRDGRMLNEPARLELVRAPC